MSRRAIYPGERNCEGSRIQMRRVDELVTHFNSSLAPRFTRVSPESDGVNMFHTAPALLSGTRYRTFRFGFHVLSANPAPATNAGSRCSLSLILASLLLPGIP